MTDASPNVRDELSTTNEGLSSARGIAASGRRAAAVILLCLTTAFGSTSIVDPPSLGAQVGNGATELASKVSCIFRPCCPTSEHGRCSGRGRPTDAMRPVFVDDLRQLGGGSTPRSGSRLSVHTGVVNAVAPSHQNLSSPYVMRSEAAQTSDQNEPVVVAEAAEHRGRYWP